MTLHMAAQSAYTNELLKILVNRIAPDEEMPEAVPPLGIEYLADWLELQIRAPRPAAPKPRR